MKDSLDQIEHPEKITPIITNEYSELSAFLRDLSEKKGEHILQPFTRQIPKTKFYRRIFYAFALLFLILSLSIWLLRIQMGHSLLFTNPSGVKAIFSSIAAILACTSFGIAMNLRPEKDVLSKLWRHAKQKLTQIQVQKQTKLGFGLTRFFIRSEGHLEIQHAHEDLLNKMHDIKDSTAHLLNEISSSVDLDRKKQESLFNQALLGFRDQINKLLNSYRS